MKKELWVVERSFMHAVRSKDCHKRIFIGDSGEGSERKEN
jgi:hypothetical protein